MTDYISSVFCYGLVIGIGRNELQETHQHRFFHAISGVLIADGALGSMGVGFDSAANDVIARGAIHFEVKLSGGVLLFCKFHVSLYRRIFGDGK